MAHKYERTDVRRSQIAHAALEIIAEGGLRSFTTRAVADHVGITDGTIFRHFKNKGEIMLAALDVLEEKMFANDESLIADPLERLEAILSARIGLVGGAYSPGRLIFSEQLIHATGPEGRDKVAQWRVKNLGLLKSCLTELAEQGRLRDDLPPLALFPIVQGLVLTAFVDRSLHGAPIAELEARIDMILGTLKTLILKPAQ